MWQGAGAPAVQPGTQPYTVQLEDLNYRMYRSWFIIYCLESHIEKLLFKMVSKVGICVHCLRMLRSVMFNKLYRFTSLQLGVIYAQNYVEWTMADSESSNVSFPQHYCWFIKQLDMSTVCNIFYCSKIVLNVSVNLSK